MTDAKFHEKHREVLAYIASAKLARPRTTTREACLAYLQKHGLIGRLPSSVLEEATREARLEREAIQAQDDDCPF